AHGFGVRTLCLRGIIDRNELAARFESLVQQIIQHDAAQSIFRDVRVSECLPNEVIATLLGTGGPANELQLVNGLNRPRPVQRAPSIDQMHASILYSLDCFQIESIHAHPLASRSQLLQTGYRLRNEILGRDRWTHSEHVGSKARRFPALPRRLSLTN